ncbi:protein SPMIP2 [Physeter macrocephalus]|uniref:Protein SPMIP2 n=1 Tax=Physeter macrocephalus TaxID=9755 RepID=A0A9W2WRT4_PHYMC|nr:uncharacterized protein C4orf45 homolog [Physeter catodon]
MLTGPDYVKDHLPKVAQHTSYIGEKRPALEKTGDLRYLQRPASKRSLPAKYKPEYVGEIGWGIPVYEFINKTRLQTGFHVKTMRTTSEAHITDRHSLCCVQSHSVKNSGFGRRSISTDSWGHCHSTCHQAPQPQPNVGFLLVAYEEFSQAAVEKRGHRYQNPWQPNPSIMDAEDSFSRGFIAWHMGDYEDTNQRNSKRAILLRQSQAALPRVSRPPKLPKLPKEQEKSRLRPLNQHDARCY